MVSQKMASTRFKNPTQTLTLIGSASTATATGAIFDGGVRLHYI